MFYLGGRGGSLKEEQVYNNQNKKTVCEPTGDACFFSSSGVLIYVAPRNSSFRLPGTAIFFLFFFFFFPRKVNKSVLSLRFRPSIFFTSRFDSIFILIITFR